MKAVILTQYGGPEFLEYTDIPKPSPGPGQILVRVYASTVSPSNLKRGSGILRGVVPELEFPWVPGADFSGVVESVGEGVTEFSAGDEVYSYGGPGGSYAEFIAVDTAAVALKPKTLTHQQAASLALVAQTAAQALDMAELKAGQTLLVTGAGGAVASVAIQLAKARGAHVVALSRPGSAERVRSLGADDVIDSDATPFKKVPKDVDVVLDALGGEFESKAYTVMKPNGILIALNLPPTPGLGERYGVRAVLMRTQNRTGTLAEISREVDAGKIKPFIIGRTYPLSQVPRAWRDYKSHTIEGKLVIDVAGTASGTNTNVA